MTWSDRPDPTTRLGIALIALTCAIYLVSLDRLPAVIGGDEVHFAIHAESLARSGHDLNGERLPAFFRITDPLVPNDSSNIWYQPVLFYLMTPFVAALGVNEFAARLPVALLAIANIWLLFAIAQRLFNRRVAIVATLMFALTPANVIVSRQALDYIALLPFVLAWLLCVLRYLESGRARTLAIGALILGAGLFSYVAAWLLMPMFFTILVAAVWLSPHTAKLRTTAIAAIAFAIPSAALVLALVWTPGALAETLARYSVSGAPRVRPDLFERVTLYWDYFNPSFLFLAGGSNPTQATGRVGVFLLAVAPLLIAGLWEIYRTRSLQGRLIVAAMFASPLPIAITMPPAAAYSIARAMTMVPFAVLVAGYGVQALARSPLRLLLAAALLTVPLQFGWFAADYRGDYQLRAAPRLDPVHMSGVADAVIRSEATAAAPAIYFSHHLDDGGARWRFFALKHGRLDLWEKSKEINLSEQRAMVAPGSLVICSASEAAANDLRAAGYREIAAVAGVTGDAAALLLKAPG